MPQASRRPIVRPQTLKKSTGNLRPTRKIDRIRNENENENETENETERVTSVLKKLVDRFRFDEPKSPRERRSIDADLWWLKSTNRNDLPEFVGTNSSRPMVRQNASTSDDFRIEIGSVSSTGVGSSPSPSSSSSSSPSSSPPPAIRSFQPIIEEKVARPIFTRLYAPDDRENDVLYQWRLQRRLEQAKTSEPMRIVSIQSRRDASTQTFKDVSIQTSPISSSRDQNEILRMLIEQREQFLTLNRDIEQRLRRISDE